jgi:prepilin-type N-terminal cleavage/methylation domain-containing protein
MKRRQPEKGMTIIELVVVVALIGIMAGVVTPSLVALDRRPSEPSAPELIDGLIRRARSTAIERAANVELTIDPTSGRFWLEPPDTSGVIAFPAGVAVASRASRVHIHVKPNGEAYIDAELFVRHGDTTTSITVDR